MKKFLIISLLTLLMGATSVTTFALPPKSFLQDFNDSLDQFVQNACNKDLAKGLVDCMRKELDNGMFPGDLYEILIYLEKK